MAHLAVDYDERLSGPRQGRKTAPCCCGASGGSTGTLLNGPLGSWSGGALLFGSELKALAAHPAFTREIDRDVLTLFIQYGYIPSPHCIFLKRSAFSSGLYSKGQLRLMVRVPASFRP